MNEQRCDQKIWRASAPSNIALIKYMGKSEAAKNQASNPSLSYTLRHLQSFVEVEIKNMSASTDTWAPLAVKALKNFEGVCSPSLHTPNLTIDSQNRYLRHLQFLKDKFQFKAHFEVRSANGFASDCGLASSASSFAALTLAATAALTHLTGEKPLSLSACSELSRQGSGSSCRSFFSPWSIWDSEGAREIDLRIEKLIHQVVVVDSSKKKVSSSEAHKRVVSSPLFQGRDLRAQSRLKILVETLTTGDWPASYQIMWNEFWDMHALFETAQPHFGYMTGESMQVLRWLQENTWEKSGDGPLITMDAGPNIHLLYRENQRELAENVQREFTPLMSVLSSYDFESHQKSFS